MGSDQQEIVNNDHVQHKLNMVFLYGGNMFKRLSNDKGQGMTEYIIIVALIAIAAIGIVTIFGKNIRELFGASSAALGGNTNATHQGDRNANSAAKTGRAKTLRDFGKNQ